MVPISMTVLMLGALTAAMQVRHGPGARTVKRRAFGVAASGMFLLAGYVTYRRVVIEEMTGSAPAGWWIPGLIAGIGTVLLLAAMWPPSNQR